MPRWFSIVLFSVFLLGLQGCSSLQGVAEKPQVNITSFSLAPGSSGLAPSFQIGVQVVNPNRVALPLKGMTYAVEIEGYRILSGATPDLPRVPAYGSADFVIQASPDLLGSARLLSDLFSTQRDSFQYLFKARLDAGSLLPMIHVEEVGRFQWNAARPLLP
ncbi:LEA type 2 family protein [Nitrincola tapanii]|uniref:Late embryogenesis abundant protein LEA-2 subgroup domain-containing protein n=1 Tax=Nitrincola tapanii TaxID=1708751 RepID=A0A5A9W7S1_9GAMM|nr:LEA type 2 family protein [Nitrincola tapanii]KAA0876514.1 hypothetical protein E1H14_01970 [Nitrincola tapanii]